MPRPKKKRDVPAELTSLSASDLAAIVPAIPSEPLARPAFDERPDMRAIGVWVLSHLSAPEHLYAPPHPMAVTLLDTCRSDDRFRSTFVSKVFDRMMVSDAQVGQTKFSDDNRDLKELTDASIIAAQVAKR